MGTKIRIENVKELIEKEGWKLISEEYTNLKTDLQLQCPNGHDCFISFEKFRKGNCECPICKQNQYYQTNDIATKKNGYRILAFDQASITSGWAVFDQEELVKYGNWTSDGTDSTSRIGKTKYWVASMIQNWKPDKIVFEDIQLQKFNEQSEGVLTYKKLAQLQGVLINYCYEKNLPYDIVPPATWRAHSEIKGKNRTDRKKNAQIKVKRLYDINVSTDTADAILIGRYAAYISRSNQIIEF